MSNISFELRIGHQYQFYITQFEFPAEIFLMTIWLSLFHPLQLIFFLSFFNILINI